jgi:hypothetical protein
MYFLMIAKVSKVMGGNEVKKDEALTIFNSQKLL